MMSAAREILSQAALSLLLVWPLSLAAQNGTRSAPTRPGAAPEAAAPAPAAAGLAVRKVNGVDYVNLADGANRLGLKFAWTERGRKAVVSGPKVRAEIEADTRDVTVNGLRVFLGDPALAARGRLYVSRTDFERCLTPMLRPGFGVAVRNAPRTIVLDPGHGGKDTGTSEKEKVYALDVAQRTRKLLEASGYNVVLTRNDDTFIELAQRPAIANANRADAFVSIHFNALPNDTRTSGVEVYTFPPRGQRSANSWSPTRKADAEDFDSPAHRQDHWNVVLAHAIHRRLVTDLKAFDRGKKLMHLGALRGLNSPGVLIECGFLTSTAEAAKIATPAYRQELAEAIAAGVREFAATVNSARTSSTASSKR